MLANWMKKNAYAYLYGGRQGALRRMAAQAWLVRRTSPRAATVYGVALLWAAITVGCVVRLFLSDDLSMITAACASAAATLYAGIAGDMMWIVDLQSKGRSAEVDAFLRKWMGRA